MDADDRTGLRNWSTASPEHFDWLARGVLRAARDAARELRREPPDPVRRTWALGLLGGQTQAMLGPGMPGHPPAGAPAQEGFVRSALAFAVHVRAHSWAEVDLGAAGVPGQDDVPHPGERRAADAFDFLGRLMLPQASPGGWTATLVTDLARGDATLEVAVKMGKYILHPTFLALTDDTTRLIGEALHNLNVRRLNELAHSLRHYASATEPSRPAAGQIPTPFDLPPSLALRPLVEGTAPPDLERLGLFRPLARPRVRLGPVPAAPGTPASPEPPHHPEPGLPEFPGPHRSAAPADPAGPTTSSSFDDSDTPTIQTSPGPSTGSDDDEWPDPADG